MSEIIKLKRNIMKKYSLLLLIPCLLQGVNAGDFYKAVDYERVNKIDSHVHANSANPTFVDVAIKNKFKLLSVNVDYPDFPPIKEQLAASIELATTYPEDFAFVGTFSTQDWEDKNFSESAIRQSKAAIAQGALGIKVWKNIGMAYKDTDKDLLMVNDDKLSGLFSYLSDNQIPVIGHQGEPKNCWLDVKDMTVKNDQQYFTAHPQYHMYLHPELPSYEDQMGARNDVLDKHPRLKFVGAHLASLEWSTDQLSVFLERYPSAVVDMAARMGQVQVQSKKDHQKVRDFFIRYQHRLLYATDLTHTGDDNKQFIKDTETRWLNDWLYMSTDTDVHVSEVEGAIKGLQLPKEVIDNIYYNNAVNTFHLPFKS